MNDTNMELNTEQTEKVLQFQDLTGIEDLSVCRDVLVRHHWDLEASVQDQLNMKEGRPSVFATETNSPVVVSDVARPDVFLPERRNEPWPWYYGGPFGFATSLIFKFFYDAFTSIIRLARSFLWPPRRYQLTDPVGDVMRHINQFEENYGEIHPVFYRGTYSQALNDAKNELRFLLVHLHSENDTDSVSFCRNTLTDPELVSFINENNILFWSCSVNSGEGQRVAETMHSSSYPYLAVIIFKESKMSVVAKFQGPMTIEPIMDRLTGAMINNGSALVAARAERMERSINQSLRAQQDEAYMASLLADQEKQRKRMEKEAKKKLAQQEEEKQKRDAEKQVEEIQNKKKEAAEKVPPEPDDSIAEIIVIVFKMPDDSRLERKFLPSHTIQDVYNFIFGLPNISPEFEISTNFPKRVFKHDSDTSETLKEVGLSSKEVMFVYDLKM